MRMPRVVVSDIGWFSSGYRVLDIEDFIIRALNDRVQKPIGRQATSNPATRHPSTKHQTMRSPLLLILSIACWPALAQTLPAPAPVTAAPPAELSTIVVPIRASLAPLLPQLESQVPK